jgi:hypothetical protein
MAGENPNSISTATAAAVRTFNCPSCQGVLRIRAAGQSLSIACGSCGAILDATNENYQIIEQGSQKGQRYQVIQLGQRGKLHGTLWEVIGYMERVDGSGVFSWSEYLLFNPMKGFRWLTEFDGHWNYVMNTKSRPDESSLSRRKATLLNKDYHLFHRGSAKVTYVLGEFYWRVHVGEKANVEDFVSPPEILSKEMTKDEVTWSLGTYVEASEIKQAFAGDAAMPPKIGVAPNQPSTYGTSSKEVLGLWGMFLCLLLVAQFVIVIMSSGSRVYFEEMVFSPLDSDRMKVSAPFEMKDGMTNVEIEIEAPVSNNWLEIQGDLVNDETGEVTEFEEGVEFYSGSDSDGYWSEGSRRNTIVLSSIPAGKYHLNLEATGTALPSLSVASQATDKIVTPTNAAPRTEKWPNGLVKSIEPIVNGKIEGIAYYFHDNGKPYAEIPFFRGEKHGKYRVLRPDGTVDQELNYRFGKLHGSSRWFDADGNLKQSVDYQDGIVVQDSGKKALGNFPVSIRVRRDVVTWSNFLWSFFLISVFPMFIWWRSRSFEVNRWSTSDFSPYYQEDDTVVGFLGDDE